MLRAADSWIAPFFVPVHWGDLESKGTRSELRGRSPPGDLTRWEPTFLPAGSQHLRNCSRHPQCAQPKDHVTVPLFGSLNLDFVIDSDGSVTSVSSPTVMRAKRSVQHSHLAELGAGTEGAIGEVRYSGSRFEADLGLH